MRLIEIHLDGFGRLVNRSFRFAPGFNLVFGPNETGKSTLQQAMLALLYGFLERGRVSSAQKEFVATIQPWDGTASYAGSLVYELDDGPTFVASRTFAPRLTTTLMAYPSRQDISDQFEKTTQGRLFFADTQLGMSRQVFENTCYVRQAELVALETSANAIAETLMRLSSSASADATSADAIALLDKAFRDQVGTDRAWTKPLPKERRHLGDLEKERDLALQARRELLSQTVELNQSTGQVAQLDLRRLELRYLRTLAELDTLRQKRDALDNVGTEISRLAAQVDEWAEWASFLVEVRDDVVRLTDQRTRLEEECANLEPRAAQARGLLEGLRSQIGRTENEVQDLSDAENVPTEELTPLRDVVNKLDLAHAGYQATQGRWQNGQSALSHLEKRADEEREALGELLELGYPGLVRLQQRLEQCTQREWKAAESLRHAQGEWSATGLSEEEYKELERMAHTYQAGAATPPPRKGCRSLFSPRSSQASNLPPPQLSQYAEIAPIYGHWAQARTELQNAKTERAQAAQETEERLGRFLDGSPDDEAFHQLEERLAKHQRLLNDIEQKRKDVVDAKVEAEEAQSAYAPLATALKAKLKALGLGVSDPHQALQAFESQCERRAELERLQAELRQKQLEAETLSRDVQALTDKRSALENAEKTLCETLTKAGIACTPDTIPDALKAFRQGVAGHARWREAQTAHRAATSRRNALLSEQSAQDLSMALATAEREVTKARSEHPDWDNLQTTKSRQEYESLIREAEEAWLSERENHNRLLEAVQSAYAHRHPAEIAEDIAGSMERIAHLERYGEALKLARGELEAATREFQKQFAPKVEQLMSEGLAQATQGRYSKAKIDPGNLDVSLIAPELGDLVNVQRLSTGTRDLIYLMLRVAIARLMSRTGESLPLLLDDPLVQCDRARQDQTLAYLTQLAEEAQILLFTKDERIRDWFVASLAAESLHSLCEL